jgi:hypothetical protein
MCEHGQRRCLWDASFLVTIHPLNNCQADAANNMCFRLCGACTRAAAYRIQQLMAATEDLSCATCGLHVTQLHDVFTVEKLVQKPAGQK